MMRKKSKYRFNSGATQSFTDGGDLLSAPDHFSPDVSGPGTISIFLSGHEDLANENLSIFEDALEIIYKSLDWHGPSLSLFYDKDGFPRVQTVFNEFNFIRFQTPVCKSMINKVKEMINANILETMAHSTEVDINIKKLRSDKADNITILSWKSTDKKEQPYNSKIKKMNRKMKQFNQQPNRGLQRSQRISNKEKREGPKDDSQSPSRKIQIIVQVPHFLDTSLEGDDVFEMFLMNEGYLGVGDYLTSLNQPSLQYNTKNQINVSNLTPSNSASSIVISRPSKRSNVDMKKTREPFLEDIDSRTEEKSSGASNSQIDHIKVMDSFSRLQGGASLDSGYAENAQFDLISHVSNFISRFLPVKFTLPDELETQIQNFSPLNDSFIDDNYPIGDCVIVFGNCYPPSFIVKATSEMMTNYDHNYYLIGKAFQLSEDHTWSWQLQVGNGTSSDPDLNVTEKSFDILHINDDNTTLLDIVETFQESIAFNPTNLITQSQIKCKPNSPSFSSLDSDSPWLKLKHIISDHSHSVCIEEALKGSLNITTIAALYIHLILKYLKN